MRAFFLIGPFIITTIASVSATSMDKLQEYESPESSIKSGRFDSESAGIERLVLSRWCGFLVLTALSLCMLGFVPAYMVGFSRGGGWYTDAISRQSPPDVVKAQAKWRRRWDVLVTIHAISALLWTLMAASQAVTGVVGPSDGLPRMWHRWLGYASFTMGCAFVGSVVTVQMHKAKPFAMWLPPIWVNTVMVLHNMVYGLYCARAKDIPSHKIAMTWACIWTAAPGFVRIFNYIYLHICKGSFEAKEGGAFVAFGSASLQLLHALLGMTYVPKSAQSSFDVVNLVIILIVVSAAAFNLIPSSAAHRK